MNFDKKIYRDHQNHKLFQPIHDAQHFIRTEIQTILLSVNAGVDKELPLDQLIQIIKDIRERLEESDRSSKENQDLEKIKKIQELIKELIEETKFIISDNMDKLTRDYMELVVNTAKKFLHGAQGITLDDLIQEGCIGLIQAMEKFDPKRGVKFSLYAFTQIRGFILSFIRKEKHLSNLYNISASANELDPASYGDEDEILLQMAIKEAFLNFDANEALVFEFRIIKGKTYNEIVEESSFSRDKVSKIIASIKEKISLSLWGKVRVNTV